MVDNETCGTFVFQYVTLWRDRSNKVLVLFNFSMIFKNTSSERRKLIIRKRPCGIFSALKFQYDLENTAPVQSGRDPNKR